MWWLANWYKKPFRACIHIGLFKRTPTSYLNNSTNETRTPTARYNILSDRKLVIWYWMLYTIQEQLKYITEIPRNFFYLQPMLDWFISLTLSSGLQLCIAVAYCQNKLYTIIKFLKYINLANFIHSWLPKYIIIKTYNPPSLTFNNKQKKN